MPYSIHPVNGKWKVTSPHRTTAKGTTIEKAKSQIRLLQAIEHNPNFKPRKKQR